MACISYSSVLLPRRRHQLLVAAHLHHPGAVEDDDEIRDPHCAEPVRDQQRDAPAPSARHATHSSLRSSSRSAFFSQRRWRQEVAIAIRSTPPVPTTIQYLGLSRLAHAVRHAHEHGDSNVCTKARELVRSIRCESFEETERRASKFNGLLRKVAHRLKEQQLKNARSRISAGDYEIVELNSVEQLVSEGRKLGLCVGHKDQLGREYHRRLRREESEFWSIRRRAKAKGLVEIDKETRCVVEAAGRRNGTLKLKRKVACGVLRELDATADSEDTFSRVGAFGAILDSRPKDTAPIEFDGYEYRVWLAPLSKQVVIEERWSAKADDDCKGSRRWSLFERYEPVLHPRRRRRGRRLVPRSPEWREGCSHPGAMAIGEFTHLLLRCPAIAERIREAL